MNVMARKERGVLRRYRASKPKRRIWELDLGMKIQMALKVHPE
jgi:hypothetical protein